LKILKWRLGYKNQKVYKKITCKVTVNGKGSNKKELTLCQLFKKKCFLCKLLEYYDGTVVKLKDNVEYLQGEVLLITFHNFISVFETFLLSVK